MNISQAGRKAIADREGNKLAAYKCSAGVWTIGVGHTSAAGLPVVKAGMRITAEESDEILSRDLATFERGVLAAVKAPLTQNQFDALVSLDFNIGNDAFARSTLVKRLRAHVARPDPQLLDQPVTAAGPGLCGLGVDVRGRSILLRVPITPPRFGAERERGDQALCRVS